MKKKWLRKKTGGTAMTTKAQEREAIENIRKIVEELGENSYVGYAMDGVLELAEDNIRENAAYSMKRQMEIGHERAHDAEERNKKHEETIKSLEATVKNAKEIALRLNIRIQEMKENEIPEELVRELYCMAHEKEAEAQSKMEQAADQIASAAIQGKISEGFAEQYTSMKEQRSRYRKVIEMLDERERRKLAE